MDDELLRGLHQKGWFFTVFLPNQPYGEVNPEFVHRFYDELGEDWLFIDVNHNVCSVRFIKSIVKPVITDGWTLMKEKFGINRVSEIQLSYFGENKFLILIHRELSDTANYPIYHSRSTHKFLTFFCDKKLSPYDIESSELVLPIKLSNFIMNNGPNTVYLCSSKNYKVIPCSIIFSSVLGRMKAKFGFHWRSFSKQNAFQVGDVLRFKLSNPLRPYILHVVVLNNN